jgi:hypothetical protein
VTQCYGFVIDTAFRDFCMHYSVVVDAERLDQFMCEEQIAHVSQPVSKVQEGGGANAEASP